MSSTVSGARNSQAKRQNLKDWGDQIKPLSNDDTAGDLSQPKLDPQQFSISELFWVLVLVAVVLAIATPFVRALPRAVFNAIIIVVSFQTLAIALMVAFVSRRRSRLLERSGTLLAIGSSTESQSRTWALVHTFFSIFMSVASQLFITAFLSLLISSQSSVNRFALAWYGIMVLSNLLGPTIFLMNGIRFLRWRIHPSTIEFFENGVAEMDTLVPWEKVELRRSTIRRNRIMVVYLALQSSAMVWLDETQIERLLAFSSEKRKAKDQINELSANQADKR